MPRPNLGRRPVQVRLTPEEIDSLDWRANEERLVTNAGDPNRSDLVRVLIAYGLASMPPGWRPEGWTPGG